MAINVRIATVRSAWLVAPAVVCGLGLQACVGAPADKPLSEARTVRCDSIYVYQPSVSSVAPGNVIAVPALCTADASKSTLPIAGETPRWDVEQLLYPGALDGVCEAPVARARGASPTATMLRRLNGLKSGPPAVEFDCIAQLFTSAEIDSFAANGDLVARLARLAAEWRPQPTACRDFHSYAGILSRSGDALPDRMLAELWLAVASSYDACGDEDLALAAYRRSEDLGPSRAGVAVQAIQRSRTERAVPKPRP